MGDASKQKRSREGLQTGNACRSDARKECQPMACFGALRAIGNSGEIFRGPSGAGAAFASGAVPATLPWLRTDPSITEWKWPLFGWNRRHSRRRVGMISTLVSKAKGSCRVIRLADICFDIPGLLSFAASCSSGQPASDDWSGFPNVIGWMRPDPRARLRSRVHRPSDHCPRTFPTRRKKWERQISLFGARIPFVPVISTLSALP